MVYKVGVLVGSQSRDSINRRLARALMHLAPNGLEFVDIDYSTLPSFNRDLEHNPPESAIDLKATIRHVDALLFVTPEYNRSVPGALKNAIDWASRPMGENSFNEKPAAVIGTSPGIASTSMAQQHLRNILSFLNVTVMSQPEGFVHFRDGLISETGEMGVESTAKFLEGFMSAFAIHITRIEAGFSREVSS